MKLKSYLKILRCNIDALRYPQCCYWRVIYPDGKRTYPIPKSEANGLFAYYGGKIILDYKRILKSLKP